MKTLNDKFANAINIAFTEYEKARGEANNYLNKLTIGDNFHKMAAHMVAQYANYQYSKAEVIPSYAIESAPEVVAALSKTKVFSNPVDIVLSIDNIQNLKTKVGIDKNTGKPYTQEQMRKSRANTQLYSTIMLIEMLDKNLSASDLKPEAKEMILDLRKSVIDSISEIYGEDAFDRIQVLKKMGSNPSVEDKRKSLKLVREFDEKAKELKFDDNFNKKLENLVNYLNVIENRTEEAQINVDISVPTVTLMYHTHPQHEEHSHKHTNTDSHNHDYMHEHGIEHTHNNIKTKLK